MKDRTEPLTPQPSIGKHSRMQSDSMLEVIRVRNGTSRCAPVKRRLERWPGRGKRAAGIAIAAMALTIPALAACSESGSQTRCPGSVAEFGDLTLGTARSLVGSTVLQCTTSSGGDETQEPTQLTVTAPWEGLLAVDGTTLPAPVDLPGGSRPADCEADPSTHTYLYVGDRWLRARTVTCTQLD